MRTMRIAIVSLVAAAICPALVAASGEKTGHAEIVDAVDEVLVDASNDGAGYAIVLEIDGDIVLERGYGCAVRDECEPFEPDTIAQIGSLTKQFTASAVLRLVETGRVDLDAPIGRYLPHLPATTARITPEQLLTHTSALPEYCGADFDAISRPEFVRKCLAAPLRFEPGTQTAYSNVGYGALAVIVERVSGQSLEAFLREEILKPAGLSSTGYFVSRDGDRYARGYVDGKDQGNIRNRIAALDGDWWKLKGNGGMQASAKDMYRWYRALNEAGTLSPELRRWLTTPHSAWKDGVAEGYGWYFRTDDGSTVHQMSHSGSDGVFFSYYWHRPQDDAFMYFVGSSGEEPVLSTLREVLRLLRSYLSGEAAVSE